MMICPLDMRCSGQPLHFCLKSVMHSGEDTNFSRETENVCVCVCVYVCVCVTLDGTQLVFAKLANLPNKTLCASQGG